MLHVDLRLDRAVHGVQEVVAVVLDVERQEVVAQQAVQDFVLPRADAERLAIGPGDVPELGDHEVVAGILEHPRQQGEVVVLDEHHRRFAADLVEHRGGELPVDLDVLLPIGAVEPRPGIGDVAQRPEGLVGEPVVVALLLGLGEPDAPEGVRGAFRGNGHAVLFVDDGLVGVAAAVGHPGAAADPHHGIQGGRQAAGRAHAADRIAVVGVDIGLAVGDDHDLQAVEPLAHHAFEAVFGPRHGILLQTIKAPFPGCSRHKSIVK
ncbi:MAG: hypothetical protein NUV77_20055 [Thermoguttaceae bacterium]|nr:hypothetical protein [Thermoguttaceae bacterium]